MRKFITICSLCVFSVMPLGMAAHAGEPTMMGNGAFSSPDNDASNNAYGLEFKPYIGVGVGSLSIRNSGFYGRVPTTYFQPSNNNVYVYALIGAELFRYLDVEMRLGTTRQDANTYDPNLGSNHATADWVWSIFAKPKVPLTDNITVYALIGGTTAKISGRGIGTPAGIQTIGSKTSSGFSYGGGLSYKTSAHFTLGAEYVQFLSRVTSTPPTNNSLSLGSYDVNLQYSF